MNILVPHLKFNRQMQRARKESMKMMNILVNNFKVNILPAQNESGGHV